MDWWWRLRDTWGHRLYDALAAAGIRLSALRRYERPVADLEADAPGDVDLAVLEPGDFHPVAPAPVAELDDSDAVVVADADGACAGYCFLSGDRAVSVRELGAEMVFGAYVWRLWVAPEHRRRGLATALVRRAVDEAGPRFGAERVAALVALDNRPSRRLFESVGFDPVADHYYASVFGREFRRERPRDP